MSLLEASATPRKSRYKTDEPVNLRVSLTNTSNKNLSVLTRNTPLDDLITDCLDVTVNGEKVEYDGPIVKRAAPTAKDYVTIKAGETIETKFPLSAAYDTSKPGTYNIELKTPIPDVIPQASGLAKTLRTEGRALSAEPIAHSTGFKVERGAGKVQTLGAAARSKEKSKKAAERTATATKKKPLGKAVLGPSTTGGTATQQKAAMQAHSDGYDLAVAALAGLKKDAHYAEWFGGFSAARFNRVKSNYTAVQTRIETVAFTYNLTGQDCGSGVFAYTYKGTETIWFCSAFWAAPAKGTDSKAGTVVHEHTHSDASTDDIQYGQQGCRNLARTNPDDAVNNADSHEYYAGG